MGVIGRLRSYPEERSIYGSNLIKRESEKEEDPGGIRKRRIKETQSGGRLAIKSVSSPKLIRILTRVRIVQDGATSIGTGT